MGLVVGRVVNGCGEEIIRLVGNVGKLNSGRFVVVSGAEVVVEPI